MRFTIDIEPEEGTGLLIAEVVEVPGCCVYGTTQDAVQTKVKALLLRVLADRLDHGEVAHAALDLIQFADTSAVQGVANAAEQVATACLLFSQILVMANGFTSDGVTKAFDTARDATIEAFDCLAEAAERASMCRVASRAKQEAEWFRSSAEQPKPASASMETLAAIPHLFPHLMPLNNPALRDARRACADRLRECGQQWARWALNVDP